MRGHSQEYIQLRGTGGSTEGPRQGEGGSGPHLDAAAPAGGAFSVPGSRAGRTCEERGEYGEIFEGENMNDEISKLKKWIFVIFYK